MVWICQEIGNPIKIDNATANCEVGYYVNVLVEIDFAKHVPSKVWIGTKYGGFFQDVLIPDCPKFCSYCKIVGHFNSECKFEKQKKNKAKNEDQVHPIIEKGKYTPKVKSTHVPFDICDTSSTIDSIVDTIQETVKVTKAGEGNCVQQNKFSQLEIVENVEMPEAIIMEVPKVLEVVQEEILNNNMVKFVDGTNGTVVDMPV
ncbi:uncharacterized protein LOC113349111 [Papaver somniferum]|uniref:uncharacterized protein LOC113349111 n=1 Tax=Papaver somniferum TaxID=3469 RepID=UPI000E6FA40B|nr:uncharacterized protein LOC113349111 [Papaver somniferum]